MTLGICFKNRQKNKVVVGGGNETKMSVRSLLKPGGGYMGLIILHFWVCLKTLKNLKLRSLGSHHT